MHLFIDKLADGQLPIYNWEGITQYYQWDGLAYWNIRACNQRVFLNCIIDEALTTLVDELPERLSVLNVGNQTSSESTLVLALRSVLPWEDFDRVVERHGVFVVGGLAFVENVRYGIDIVDRDPAYLIEQICLALAGKNYDPSIPEIYERFIGDPSQYTSENRSRRAEEAEKKRHLIEVKARAVLCAHLDELQQAEFASTGVFHVRSSDGYTYLITDGSIQNIYRLENGRRTIRYCIVTDTCVPSHDQMLAQKLLLESNPEMFHKIARASLLPQEAS